MSFDLAILGAGPGGYVCAIRAAQLGLKVALIEKGDRLGGTCLNVGCIPSKALLESSEWYHDAIYKFPAYGIVGSSWKLNLNDMMGRKAEVVNTLTDGISLLMKKNKVTVFKGTGRLLGAGLIELEESSDQSKIQIPKSKIEASNIVLAMGSVPVELPFLKFDGKQIVSSTEALSFAKVPDHLIVVGAGAVGLELGSVWRRLGSKVTVVEMLPNIVPFADKQLTTLLQRALVEQGIEFHLNAKVTSAKVKGKQGTLSYTDKDGAEQSLTGDKILVAVGRKANLEGSGLTEAGVVIERGKVVVDERFQTNLPGVYAIGDLIQGPMLAHKASEEGVAVAEMIAGHHGFVNYNVVPNVVYTHPELAVVGLSEDEAKTAGRNVKAGKFFFRGNGRALSLGSAEGMVKVVADADTDRILGVHILGPRASDLIAEAAVAMEFAASAEDIGRTIHAHPTLAEALKEAALAVNKMQIHG
jgi:dihydrolipoamide dehydrogenase